MLCFILLIIIFFFKFQKSFHLEFDALNKLVENSNIEAACLITRNFSEKMSTYNAVKKFCSSSQFITIDLNDYEEDVHNGYGDIIELLRNNIWSSVHISHLNCKKNASSKYIINKWNTILLTTT